MSDRLNLLFIMPDHSCVLIFSVATARILSKRRI